MYCLEKYVWFWTKHMTPISVHKHKTLIISTRKYDNVRKIGKKYILQNPASWKKLLKRRRLLKGKQKLFQKITYYTYEFQCINLREICREKDVIYDLDLEYFPREKKNYILYLVIYTISWAQKVLNTIFAENAKLWAET